MDPGLKVEGKARATGKMMTSSTFTAEERKFLPRWQEVFSGENVEPSAGKSWEIRWTKTSSVPFPTGLFPGEVSPSVKIYDVLWYRRPRLNKKMDLRAITRTQVDHASICCTLIHAHTSACILKNDHDNS